MKSLFMILLSAIFLFGADVYATFIVSPKNEAHLSLAASGIVAATKAEIGDRVKKGDTLLVLQNKEEEEMASVAKAQFESTKVEYEFAKSQYERYKKSKDAFDANTLERVRFEYEAKEKALIAAKHSVALSLERFSKTTLKAPFDGTIADKNVEMGDGVTLGGKPLFRLISNESKLVLSSDSKFASTIKRGQAFIFQIDGKESSCKIYKIYPSANEQNRKLNAECDGGALMSGLFGDGVIKIE